MKPAALLYRCAACDTLFAAGHTPDGERFLAERKISHGALNAMHECSIRINGLAAFAGVQFDGPKDSQP